MSRLRYMFIHPSTTVEMISTVWSLVFGVWIYFFVEFPPISGFNKVSTFLPFIHDSEHGVGGAAILMGVIKLVGILTGNLILRSLGLGMAMAFWLSLSWLFLLNATPHFGPGFPNYLMMFFVNLGVSLTMRSLVAPPSVSEVKE